MAEFPALPLWTDAYIADTQHLTNEEHGVYLRLIMFAWRTPECALPDDDKRLAIMVGVTPKKWATLKVSIMSFWTKSNGRWTQKKLTAEREFVERQREQKRSAGIASSKAKSLRNNNTASTAEPTAGVTADPTADPTARQQPTPTPIKDKKAPPTASPKKGCRLPADFRPDREWSLAQGLPADVLTTELIKFRNYWNAKTGQGATKLDWHGTWQNWILKAVADHKRRGGRLNGQAPPEPRAPRNIGERAALKLRERLNNASGKSNERVDAGDGRGQGDGTRALELFAENVDDRSRD